MAYTAITNTEIASGEPTSNATWTKVQQDLADHETRLETVEGSVNIFPSMIFRVNGYYGVNSDILKVTLNFNLTITGIRVLIDKAGSAGTTEIDLLKSSAGSVYQSLLLTRPSVGFASGNDALSTNTVLDGTKVTMVAGDILRLDITSVQTDGKGFIVRVDYTR